MAKSGSPVGPKVVASKTMVSDAIRMALLRDPARLARIGEQLVNQCDKGNLQALALLLDRLEGKAVQQVVMENETRFVVVAPQVSRNPEEWALMHAPKLIEGEAEDVSSN